MAGVTAAMVGSGGASFSGVLTVGSAFIGGKGFSSTAYGFGTAASPYGAFGSLTPATWRGFTIIAIYQADSDGTTVFEVSGDASAFTPTLTAGGVNQSLGAGTFGGGITSFSGAASDPFFGMTNVAITIS